MRRLPKNRLAVSKKRLATALAAATVLAFGLTSCASGESDGPVDLRFSWWGGDARAQITEEVIAEFESQNPDITITPEPGEWSAYWDRLATATAGGDAPDVMQMDESYIGAYGERGALLDLGTQSEILDVSDMDENVLGTGEVDGALVGIPVGIAIYSVGVNPSILERAGVEMPDDTTWTWDDFIEISTQVSDALGSEGITGFDFYGSDAAELGAFARQAGQEIFPREDEEPVTAETIEAYFERGLEMIETGATPEASLQNEGGTAALDQSPFATNRSAFHMQFHTQIQAFASASGSDMQLLRLPAASEGESPKMVNKASMYWSISSQTEHPEEAARFVDFLINDEDAAQILLVERGVTAIPEIQAAIQPSLDATGQMSLQFASTMQDEVVEPPQVTPATASGWGDAFQRIGSDVKFGIQTPAEAAQATLDLLASYDE